MVNFDEVIEFFKGVKITADKLDEEERHDYVMKALSKYSLEEWCEVGHILISSGLLDYFNAMNTYKKGVSVNDHE